MGKAMMAKAMMAADLTGSLTSQDHMEKVLRKACLTYLASSGQRLQLSTSSRP
jgi:hypothetical protein